MTAPQPQSRTPADWRVARVMRRAGKVLAALVAFVVLGGLGTYFGLQTKPGGRILRATSYRTAENLKLEPDKLFFNQRRPPPPTDDKSEDEGSVGSRDVATSPR